MTLALLVSCISESEMFAEVGGDCQNELDDGVFVD